MKHIAILAVGLLAAALVSPAQAQVKEAEKLFRDMEKKLLTAKAFQFEKRKAKGELLVTQDNKLRLKVVGNFDGKPKAGFELVSDGTQLKSKGARLFVQPSGLPAIEAGGQSEEPTPQDFHKMLANTVSRGGVWYAVFIMPYLVDGNGEIDPDREESKIRVYDFKLVGADKVGAKEAKVIRYRFGSGSARFDEEITLWLDAKTLLPLKRSFTLKIGDARIVDTYHEFRLDPKIDARAFELPK